MNNRPGNRINRDFEPNNRSGKLLIRRGPRDINSELLSPVHKGVGDGGVVRRQRATAWVKVEASFEKRGLSVALSAIGCRSHHVPVREDAPGMRPGSA